MSLRHIILFKVRDGVSEEQIDHAIEVLKDLGVDNEAILEWRIEKSQDERKGIVIVENSLFRSAADLESFRTSEKHLAAIDVMKEISDWSNGDYLENTE